MEILSEKIKKKFDYNGIELKIVEREEYYLNSGETMKMIRVIAPSGGVIPVKIRHKQTLKSIIEDTIETLDNFNSVGMDVKNELTKTTI
jgi:hypothetical protein